MPPSAPPRGPPCSPGSSPAALPVNDNAEELPATAVTFVHYLRRAGYRTVLSGKMHYVGPDQLHGFEERLTTDIYPADFLWTKTWDSPRATRPAGWGCRGTPRRGQATCARWPRWSGRPAPFPGATSTTTTKRRTTGPWGAAHAGPAQGRGGRPAMVPLRLLHPPPRPLRQPAPVLGPLRGAGDCAPPGPPGGLAPAPHRRLDQRLPRRANLPRPPRRATSPAPGGATSPPPATSTTSWGRCWASWSAWAWARTRWSWSPPTTGTCASGGCGSSAPCGSGRCGCP